MAGICFLLGFISVLYFLGIWRMTGLSSKFPLVWLLIGGGFFLAGSCIYFGIEIPVWFSGLIGIFLGGFLLLLVFSECLIISAMRQKEVKNLDYIVVLGAQVRGNVPSKSLQYRIDRAEKYLKENKKTKVVLSGGKGEDEGISEAQCMAEELGRKGIAFNRLLLEKKSRNTEQNITFTIPIIQQDSKKDLKELKIGIVTNGFHIYRGSGIAQKKMQCKVYGIARKFPLFTGELFASGIFWSDKRQACGKFVEKEG